MRKVTSPAPAADPDAVAEPGAAPSPLSLSPPRPAHASEIASSGEVDAPETATLDDAAAPTLGAALPSELPPVPATAVTCARRTPASRMYDREDEASPPAPGMPPPRPLPPDPP